MYAPAVPWVFREVFVDDVFKVMDVQIVSDEVNGVGQDCVEQLLLEGHRMSTHHHHQV